MNELKTKFKNDKGKIINLVPCEKYRIMVNKDYCNNICGECD